MRERYPGYDVLAKRDTPSWNEQTRRVVEERLRTRDEPRFLPAEAFATLVAICDRVVPQLSDRARIPVAGLVDAKLLDDRQDGYRAPDMPRERDAWLRGLAAVDAEARAAHGQSFAALDAAARDALLDRMKDGDLRDAAWGGMPCKSFYSQRLLPDIVHAYYAHPTAWSEIGWGGPASPRGYVRMGYDERDPWEAAEAKPAAGAPGAPATARATRRVG